ncbi:MAG: hypothetical protein QM747_21740 [Nocardioides sp.]
MIIGKAEGPERTPEEEEGMTTRFVVAESQVLLHHAAEAALRMFIAHSANPDCPWLEMAALLDFREFRDQVDQIATSVVPRWVEEGAGWVMLGRAPQGMDDAAREALQPSLRLLQALARRVQEDKNLYNAAKHGMTLLPGVGSIALTGEDGQSFLGAEGTQVMYLERDAEWTWSRTTRFVSAHEAFALTQAAILLMDSMWRVAKVRYLDEDAPVEISLVSAELVEGVLTEFKSSGVADPFQSEGGDPGATVQEGPRGTRLRQSGSARCVRLGAAELLRALGSAFGGARTSQVLT